MNKKLKNILKIVFGLGILIFLVYKIGFTDIWSRLDKVNWIFLPIIIIILILSIIIGSLNIVIFIRAFNEKYRFLKIVKYYMMAWAYGLLILGRLGEFSLIYFLKKEKIGTEKGTVITLLDKAITFVCFFIVSLFGIFTFFHIQDAVIIVLIILVVSILFGIFVLTDKGRDFIRKKILGKYSNLFKGFSKNMDFILKERKKEILINVFLTFIKLFLTALFLWVLFFAFRTRVDYIPILIVIATITIISLIPISIGGLGIRETSAVLLFLRYGVEASLSASVLLFYAVLRYILAFFFIGYGFIKRK